MEWSLDRELLGRRLAATRTLRRMSQQQIASELDISQAAYSQWELGKNLMSLDKFAALVVLLDVDADWLAGLPNGKGNDPF